ncbi:uncharacterized protein CANTADRAFT_6141 [Suhomyces tanzawaensis NRRL Y-17324]|uniref:Sensitive to high expression protein 9, mitochondrial n=1 Tax=Suhomyces tanzawaensis NRRL Y-17324 TaxID=984487 RepID=A0A1E4SHG6_9ASCO|nr:uncharacterized protein CANTADRAFT_6141 [Suhomyces tanzawaensis NRRL Y-17324]ODV78943.1 hypothetical protein CANTADRAFT_6141 [Suhomyces tanzawaensis NRRL Y-17324]
MGLQGLLLVRLQSKTVPPASKLFDDAQLQKIIESTNFGTEARRERQREKAPLPSSEIPHSEDLDPLGRHHGAAADVDSQVDPTVEISKAFASTDLNKPIPKKSPSTDKLIKETIDELPSNMERQRSEWSKRVEAYLQSILDTLFTASTALNDVTGYSGIERLKRTVDELENELRGAKDNVRVAKGHYSDAIQQRSTLQREINELLTRKHNWSSNDLERFTELYRNDHANQQREATTEAALNDAELNVDAVQLRLTQLILTRYHEEQIWSDKIRKASTWGTWVLMGINVVLFVVATFLVEPWKRKRLVGSFEDKVKQVLVELAENGTAEETLLVGNVTDKLVLASAAGELVESPETPEVVSPGELVVPVGAPVPVSFNVYGQGWDELKSTVGASCQTLGSKQVSTVAVDKTELAVVTAMVGLLGAGLGALVTVYVGK